MSTILDEQIAFIPQVVGSVSKGAVVVCGGMGGSALPVLLARFLGVSSYLALHRDYGTSLRVVPDAHYIALSHSGNTEETFSFTLAVQEQGLPISIVTSGGALLALAKEKNIPYVQVPAGVQPRDSVLAMTKGLLALLGEEALLKELAAPSFDVDAAQAAGNELGEVLKERTPVFYSSADSEALSYIAKIQCNETAKIPAFSNAFPELNHNEMQGWGVGDSASGLTAQFLAVFLKHEFGNPLIQKRMALTQKLLDEKGIRTKELVLPSESRTQTALYTWWMMRSAARTLAAHYGVDADAVPLIEAFKKSL